MERYDGDWEKKKRILMLSLDVAKNWEDNTTARNAEVVDLEGGRDRDREQK